MKLKALALLFLCFLARTASAQNTEFTTWGAWFNSYKFSEHWGMMSDVQVRSADDVKYVRNVLIRPFLLYHFNKKYNVGVSYAYVSTNGRNAAGEHTYRPEGRITQQFTINTKAGTNSTIQHRFRLEQRFQGSTATQPDVFSQRFRYFIRAILPIANHEPTFTKGMFVALQNEAFANVQNKAKLNNHFFDQNRAYVGVGYRVSKVWDVEAGYLNQYIKSASSHTINNVVQVALYTRFGQ